ncbi:MAG: hypothetical protein JWO82_4274 [Akkermansiaceae bacterium]|nr:hypothetical protein [Akkermansiaceae bacterium]
MLVTRYLDQVHALARRVTGDDELARDAVQTAFIRLAERAALISHHLPLAAWLHHVVRCQAVDLVRAETRRRKREWQATLVFPPMDTSAPEPDWSALAPVVDELVDQLPTADRNLLLLRYYRNESHAVIAARLGLTEGVARKRAYRAVEKLRALLGKRGITTSAAALAGILPAHAAPAAPAFLATAVLQATQGIVPVSAPFLTALFITVNTSQKIALAGSLLLLVAATAYTYAPDPAATALAAAAASPGDAVVASGKAGQRSGFVRERLVRPAPGTPEERLERLRAIVSNEDAIQREADLIAYLDGLPPGLFGETVTALRDLQRVEFNGQPMALSAWMKVDHVAALEFCMDPSNSVDDRLLPEMLGDWAASDPEAALAWALQSSRAAALVQNILWGIAQASPEDLGKRIRELPDGEAKYLAFDHLTTQLAEDGDPGLLPRIVAGLSESQRAVLYGNLAIEMKDYPKAVDLLKQHPEGIPFSSPEGIVYMWSNIDYPTAIAAVAGLPAGELKKQAAAGLIHRMSERDIRQAEDLLEQYPDVLSPSTLSIVIENVGKSDPALALDLTPKISGEAERHEAIAGQLSSWLINDPAAAAGWLAAHPQPAAVTDRLPQSN